MYAFLPLNLLSLSFFLSLFFRYDTLVLDLRRGAQISNPPPPPLLPQKKISLRQLRDAFRGVHVRVLRSKGGCAYIHSTHRAVILLNFY